MLGELTLTVEATSSAEEHRTSGNVRGMVDSPPRSVTHRRERRSSYSPRMPRLTAATAVALVGFAIVGCGNSKPQPSTSDPLAKLDVKLPAPTQLRAATPPLALQDSLCHLPPLSQFRGKTRL